MTTRSSLLAGIGSSTAPISGSGSSGAGGSLGSGTSSAGGGSSAPASGGIAPSLPPRSAIIDFDGLQRGVATQEFFVRLISHLMEPYTAPLFEILPGIPSTNILLYDAFTAPWSDFKDFLPSLTIFLLPLVIGFSGPNSNTIVQYEPPRPYLWSDNGERFPLGVFVLSKRVAGENVFIFGGTILPTDPSPLMSYHGLKDSEVGMEWIVPSSCKANDAPRMDLTNLKVIVPSDNLKISLINLLVKSIPSLDEKVPGILYPASGKNYYVHPDGILEWHTHDYGRPSVKDEFESRFVLRNMRASMFLYLMVAHHKITIDPAIFFERLIAVSLKNSSEVCSECESKNGLYHSEVRHLRILTDPVRQARFIRGEWLGSFRLDHLSLYDFMPTTHHGFDYNESSHDTFAAFKYFIMFCAWVFGDHWTNKFMDDVTRWQTKAPWTETIPWVLHLCLEKAISSWVVDCLQDASMFHYESVKTSLGILTDYLNSFMSPGSLLSVEKVYNRSLAHEVVYPTPDCNAPLGIPSTRPSPRFGPARNYSDSGHKAVVSARASSSKSSSEVNMPKALVTKDMVVRRDNAPLKRTLSVESSRPEPKVAKATTRYCHANIAYAFEFMMLNDYVGSCKSPESAVSCTCGQHFTKGNLPSIEAVIRSFGDIRAKLTSFSEELLDELKKRQA